jgi:hypothetical protein
LTAAVGSVAQGCVPLMDPPGWMREGRKEKEGKGGRGLFVCLFVCLIGRVSVQGEVQRGGGRHVFVQYRK